MQLGAVDEGVHKVPAFPPGLHAGRLPLGAVGEHGSVVLACGDALGDRESGQSPQEREQTRQESVVRGGDR